MGWLASMLTRLGTLGASAPATGDAKAAKGKAPAARKKTTPHGAAPPGSSVPSRVPSSASDVRAEALARIRSTQHAVMTPEREELLRQAMAVHQAKQKILANLSDDQRRQLMLVAMRTLLHEGREDGGAGEGGSRESGSREGEGRARDDKGKPPRSGR